MRISLNHTIVNASDRHASAVFFADLLGLERPTTYGPFSVVQVGDTSLDFADDHAAPRTPTAALRLPCLRSRLRRHLGADTHTREALTLARLSTLEATCGRGVALGSESARVRLSSGIHQPGGVC